MNRLAAIDLGNSFAKWALMEAGRLQSSGRVPVARLDAELCQQVLEQAPAGVDAWAVASVNPPASAALAAALQAAGVGRVLWIGRDRPVPIATAVDEPERVGCDRLLAALAAHHRAGAGRPTVVIDCGSAITIDAVSADGVFRGGIIAPGVGLSARALANFTAALPRVDFRPPEQAIGRNTREAICSGLYFGAVGLLRLGLEAVCRQLSRDAASAGAVSEPLVLATGGDAPLLAPHLGRPVELAPHLVLEGIWLTVSHTS